MTADGNWLCEKHDAGYRPEEGCALCQIEELVPLYDVPLVEASLRRGVWGNTVEGGRARVNRA